MFKSRHEEVLEEEVAPVGPPHTFEEDAVETIVGPSVEVEGDFSSKGNMVVQGTVSGNVRTAKSLRVEQGAKILANVHAENAKISGEIRGNVKIVQTLELTPSAVVVGDVEAATLIVAPGAILHGKCSMPGKHVEEMKAEKAATKNMRTRVRQTSSTNADEASTDTAQEYAAA